MGEGMCGKWLTPSQIINTNENDICKFKKTLKFKNVIILCYGQQQAMALQQRVLKIEVWAIAKALAPRIFNNVHYMCDEPISRSLVLV